MRSERTTAGLGGVGSIVGMRRVSGRSGSSLRVGPGRSAFAALLISLAVAATGILATGQSLTVSSVMGIFTNTVLTDGRAASGDGTASIRWGTPTAGSRSGYDFVAAAVSSLGPGAPVVIGTFTHQNWPITGDTLRTANLKVTIAFNDQRITDPSIDITIPLAHDETPNQANPCAYPSGPNQNGCADAVTIGTVTSEPIVIGGVLCTVSVWFGNGSTQFLTAEQAANSISLYLQFSCPSFNPLLDITKTGPATATIGQTVTYDFAVSHAPGSDGSPVGSITVSDSVAGAATLVSKTGGDQDGYLESGETWNYRVTYTVSPNDPSPLQNTGCVSGLDIDGQTISDCATHATTIPQHPSIGLTKTASSGPYTVGKTITYTFLVTNPGDVTLHGISISDPLIGLSAISGYATTLVPGASTTGTATYVLTQADVDRGSVVNLATATGTSPSGVSVTASDDATISITQNPLVAIAKVGTLNMTVVAPTNRADAGDKITYAFTVTNSGNVTLTNVTVTDPKVTVVGGPIASLAPGASDSTTFTATYTLTQTDINAGSVANTATATGMKPGGGTVTGSGNTTVTLPPAPALAIEKTGDVGPVAIGDSVGYTITVTNTGNITLHNVVASDARLGWNQTVGTLAVGASAVYNLVYGPVTESDLPGPIHNTAVADSDETGSVSDDHSVDILELIDLSLTQVVDEDHPAVGDVVTLTLSLSNEPDAGTATGVTVRHTLGSGFEFVSSTPARGSYDGATGQWNVGTLEAGETVHLVIRAKVLAQGSYASAAEVETASENDVDSMPANAAVVHEDDDARVTVTPPAADLAIEKFVSDPMPSEGDTVDFTLELRNEGPDAATGVVVDDALPGGLTYVADTSAGAYNSATGAWSVGELPVGATATLRLTVRVDAGTLGITIENTAIAVPGSQLDSDLSNNRATATVHVPSAELQVRKVVNVETPVEGETVIFSVEISNLGPDTALGVRVADLLPAGLTYARHSGSGGYDPTLGVWSIGALAAGQVAALELVATVNAGTAGLEITNVAAVAESSLPDPDTTNNRAVASVTVSGGGGGGGSADTCSGKVIINEVAWAGTAADPQGQWIELRNIGREDVNLEGWVLRWRKKVPVTEEDYLWKEVRLSGVLAGASPSACELALVDPVTDIEFVKRDDVSWLVLAEPREEDDSYFLLERKTDDTIRNIDADIVYDTIEPYTLELSPEGDMMQLVDSRGAVVDTANAFESADGRWPAGEAATFATMERTDPLVADAETNWHTNLGIVTRGEDSNGRPLVATARVLNSQPVDAWTVYAETLTPAQTVPGTQYDVALDLTQADRLATGWPWIRVTRVAEAVGGGGAVADTSSYTFSSRTEDGLYWVDIDTTGMAPGEHLVWIVFGEGKAILVPIQILP